MAAKRRLSPNRGTAKQPVPHVTPQVRWRGFRAFEDTDWLSLSPLTVLLGPNNAGKTSLIAPILLLKQTIESTEDRSPLVTEGALLNAGPFLDLLHEHDAQSSMHFGIRFHFHEAGERSLRPVGTFPPGVLEVEIGPSARDGGPELRQYCVSDLYGRLYLRRVRQDGGKYSLEKLPNGGSLPSIAPQLEQIRRSRPEWFLFTSRGVLRYALELRESQPALRNEMLRHHDLAFSGRASLYLAIVDHTHESMRRWLSAVRHIGPLRVAPERVYPVGTDRITSVGVDGRKAPELLHRSYNELAPFVNKWIKRLEFGERIECATHYKSAFQVLISRQSGVQINIADTGFGLSQVLPILVQAAASSPGDTLIVEQPEIHLNPRLQYELADLFVELIEKRCTVVVETHSEHLLLRLRRLLAERRLKHDLVSLLYVEKQGKVSRARSVPVAENGAIAADDWPRGFFEEALSEALALASAQASHARG